MAAATRQRRPRGSRRGEGGGPRAVSRHVFAILSDSLGPGRGNEHVGRTSADPLPTDAAQYVNDSRAPLPYKQISATAAPIYHPDSGSFVERISMAERLLIDYGAASGAPTGVIPCGVGGASLELGWNYATPGTNLVEAEASYTDAMAKFTAFDGVAPTYVGTVIALSSNDGTSDLALLKTRWLGLIDRWRAHIGSDAPFFLCGPVVGSSDGSSHDQKRRVVEQVAAERVNCFLVHPPYPTTKAPDVHPSVDENRMWGAALAVKARQAMLGTEPVPTFSVAGAQACDLGSPLAINLTHSGLATSGYPGTSPYGTVVITGGADASAFEIAGGFHAPVLRWAGNGTGPAVAGDYDVEVRLRNGAWQFGPPLTITVNRPAANQPLLVKAGYASPASITGAYGSWQVSDFTVKKGWNWIFYTNGTGGFKNNVVMLVDGSPAIKVAGSISTDGRNTELWRYQAAEDKVCTLRVNHDGAAMSGISVVSVATEGYAATPASAPVLAANLDERGSGTRPHPGAALTCPDGGAILRLALFSAGPQALVAGSSSLVANAAGTALAAYRTTSGAVDYEGAGAYARWVSLALPAG